MQHQGTEVPGGTTGTVATRLWAAARKEFAAHGYHGARVQGIARRAGCNVALLYRHWASKRALYVEILRSVWTENAAGVGSRLAGAEGARGLVNAFLETSLSDPEGSQILVREYLDGGPFLREIHAADPGIDGPLRTAAEALHRGNGHALRTVVDPETAMFTVGAMASLIGAAHHASDAEHSGEEPGPAEWRRHLEDMLLHGLVQEGPAAS